MDLAFIALPFTRTFLGNGYMGNAQAGAGGLPNSLGMNGAGMNRIGGMGGMGMQGNMAMTSPQQQPNASGRVQLVSNSSDINYTCCNWSINKPRVYNGSIISRWNCKNRSNDINI